MTWVHVPSEKRQKLDAKSVRCLLVGYEEDAGSRVYRLYDPVKRKVIVSRDVMIDESSVISSPHESSMTTVIEWEKDTHLKELQKGETREDGFQPLDTISPEADSPDRTMGIQETITVRP